MLDDSYPVIDMSDDADWKAKLDFELWSEGSATDYQNDRNRPYNGQPHTDQGERGKQEITGITMRDLCDCFVKAILLSTGEGELYNKAKEGTWRYQDVYDARVDVIDLMAVCQNMTCEVERMMGIFPNIPVDTSTVEQLFKHWTGE